MGKTSIEWTEHSVNPIRTDLLDAGGNVIATGHHCEKISPGCKLCYASRLQPRFGLPPFDKRQGVSLRHRLDEKVLESVLRRRKPTTYFWEDMSDLFHDDYRDEWLDRCFAVMALTPHHTHQVLTKRPDRAWEWYRPGRYRDVAVADQAKRIFQSVIPFRLPSAAIFDARRVARGEPWEMASWPLPHVHLGVSVESPDYLWRVDVLRKIAPAVPWVSYEPALAAVDFTPHLDFLKWIVVGGESGTDARPFDLEWARKVIGDCKRAGVAVFMKQLGKRAYEDTEDGREWTIPDDKKGGDIQNWPEEFRVREFPKA